MLFPMVEGKTEIRPFLRLTSSRGTEGVLEVDGQHPGKISTTVAATGNGMTLRATKPILPHRNTSYSRKQYRTLVMRRKKNVTQLRKVSDPESRLIGTWMMERI